MATTEEKKQEKEEQAVFEVGDRVILGGLKNAAHLNGMHGTVAVAATEPEAGDRCGVDLDLILPGKGRISVKPANLSREPPIPEDCKRAAVAGGSLVKKEGYPCSCCLDYVRCVVATEFMPQDDINSLDDLHDMRERGSRLDTLRQNQLIASGWTYWTDPGGLLGVNPGGVYASVRESVRKLADANGGLEATCRLDPTYRARYDAMDDYSAVKGWNVRVTGNFWICGMDEAGTYLIPEANLGQVYQCVGVKDPIWTQLPFGKPVMLHATMVSWYGRLVYDGVLTPPDGFREPPFASNVMCRQLEEAVEAAKREGRVVTRLRQLEVPGGSRTGIHDHVVKLSPTSSQQQQVNSAPTAAEKQLVEKIARFPLQEGGTDGRQISSWVFRRYDYTEHENPDHTGFILDNGVLLGLFQCSALIPTPLDILRPLLQTCRRIGTRPEMVGIDDRVCCDRVQALFKSHGVSGTEAYFYAPPTPEETAAATALGDFQELQQRM